MSLYYKLSYYKICSHTLLLNMLPTDCGDTFQSQLTELIATKQSCDSAGFYDCCKVQQYNHGYMNECVCVCVCVCVFTQTLHVYACTVTNNNYNCFYSGALQYTKIPRF